MQVKSTSINLPGEALLVLAANMLARDPDSLNRHIGRTFLGRDFRSLPARDGLSASWVGSEALNNGVPVIRLISNPRLHENNSDLATIFDIPVEELKSLTVSFKADIKGTGAGVDFAPAVDVDALKHEIDQLEKQVADAEDWGNTCSRKMKEAQAEVERLKEQIKSAKPGSKKEKSDAKPEPAVSADSKDSDAAELAGVGEDAARTADVSSEAGESEPAAESTVDPEKPELTLADMAAEADGG